MADFIRVRDSLRTVSGSPMMVSCGKPVIAETSTFTANEIEPEKLADVIILNIFPPQDLVEFFKSR